MKVQKLVTMFEALKDSNAIVNFGDLLRKGYSSALIFNAIAKVGAKLYKCNKGYTVIAFR